MHRAGERLDEDRLLVRQRVRQRVQLRVVRDELAAPAAARVRAESRLQTGGDVADGDPVAPVALPGSARVAGFETPGLACEHWVEHDAGADRHARGVVERLADDFVTGNERLDTSGLK